MAAARLLAQRMNRKQRMADRLHRGFSLPELMVVVCIIGILASIAVANFIGFTCRSKTAEAKSILKGIYVASLSYQSEHETFTDRLALLGLDIHLSGSTTGVGLYYYFAITRADQVQFDATADGVVPRNGGFKIGYFGPNNVENGAVQIVSPPCN